MVFHVVPKEIEVNFCSFFEKINKIMWMLVKSIIIFISAFFTKVDCVYLSNNIHLCSFISLQGIYGILIMLAMEEDCIMTWWKSWSKCSEFYPKKMEYTYLSNYVIGNVSRPSVQCALTRKSCRPAKYQTFHIWNSLWHLKDLIV